MGNPVLPWRFLTDINSVSSVSFFHRLGHTVWADIPRDEVEIDPPIPGVLHHPLPKADLLIDRQPLHHIAVVHHILRHELWLSPFVLFAIGGKRVHTRHPTPPQDILASSP